jgi:hypothetical protein
MRVARGGAEPLELCSCGPCRVAALQSPDSSNRGAATRLLQLPLATEGFAALHPIGIKLSGSCYCKKTGSPLTVAG